jgi:predicted deacylase
MNSLSPAISVPRPISVDHLVIDDLKHEAVSRVLVTIAHDGLGRPTQIPVLVARGSKPGPTFGITAAVHGNELNGIPVIHRLFERLDIRKLRGTIVAAVVVNVPAFLHRQRCSPDGYDLNHHFPGQLSGHSTPMYAHRFVERILRRMDFLVDLHTASEGRWNSLYVRADMRDSTTAAMARRQKPQIIVHNPASDGTLRGLAHELGIPAITVEIGNPQRFQGDFVRRSLSGVRGIMGDLGVLPKTRISTEGPAPIICSRSGWLFTDVGGLLRVKPDVVDQVKSGDLLATVTSVFGDRVAEYRSPHDGIIIGRSADPVAETGARLVHLGEICEPGEFGGPESDS